MYKKIILLLIISSFFFSTSCQKQKEEEDLFKSIDIKTTKRTESDVDSLLKNHRWEVTDITTNGTVIQGAKISGLKFKSEQKVDVYYSDYAPFDNSTLEERNYDISTDLRKIKINGRIYSFTVRQTTLTLKSRDMEYTLKKETEF